MQVIRVSESAKEALASLTFMGFTALKEPTSPRGLKHIRSSAKSPVYKLNYKASSLSIYLFADGTIRVESLLHGGKRRRFSKEQRTDAINFILKEIEHYDTLLKPSIEDKRSPRFIPAPRA